MKNAFLKSAVCMPLLALVPMACSQSVRTDSLLSSYSLNKTSQNKTAQNETAQNETAQNETEQWYSLVKIEHLRDSSNPFLVSALTSSYLKVAVKAAYVLAHMPELQFFGALKNALSDTRPELRSAAVFALSQFKNIDARNALLNLLKIEKNTEVRATVFQALGNCALAEDLEFLSNAMLQNAMTESTSAARGISGLFYRLKYFTPGAPAASFSAKTRADIFAHLPQLQSDAALLADVLHALFSSGLKELSAVEFAVLSAVIQNSPESQSAVTIIDRLRSIKSPEVALFLRTFIDSNAANSIKLLALQALSRQPVVAESLKTASLYLENKDANLQQMAIAVLAAAKKESQAYLPLLSQVALNSASAGSKVAALNAIIEIDASQNEEILREHLKNSNQEVTANAIAALEKMSLPNRTEILYRFTHETNVVLASTAFSTLAKIPAVELNADLAMSAVVSRAFNSKNERLICSATELVGARALSEFKASLNSIALSNTPYWLKECALNAMATAPVALANLKTAENLTKMPMLDVAQIAIDLIQKMTHRNLSARKAKYNAYSEALPSLSDINKALSSEISMVTTKGLVRMRLKEGAPLNAAHFVKLVQSGFYDDNRLFRVVPNFVVQFGDKAGDGGSSGNTMMRDEFSAAKHDFGTVGLATRGTDTGDSQLFFNTQNNHNLDNNYTVLGEIVTGAEIIGNFNSDDRIIKATVSDSIN